MANDPSIEDRVSKLGVEYRNGLISKMAEVLGNRPSNSEKIGPQRELELWLRPTSPAAKIVLQRGGSMDEAHQANAMWANHLRSQGAPEDLILETCRQYAFERGKAHGKGDLKREVEWHEKMAEKAAAMRAGQPIDDGGEGSGDGSSDNGPTY